MQLPDLSIELIKCKGREFPWDLTHLLFTGGASTPRKKFAEKIKNGETSQLNVDRMAFVLNIHAEIEGDLTAGKRRDSAIAAIRFVSAFFAWADSSGAKLSLESLPHDFREWTEDLIRRVRSQDINSKTAYLRANAVAHAIDSALDLKAGTTLRRDSRISHGSMIKRSLGTRVDKQNLQATFCLGHMLQDLSASLTPETIMGPLPISVSFRDGQRIEIWSGMARPTLVKALHDHSVRPHKRQQSNANRSNWSADKSFKTRHSVVNTKIEAEMLIFIAQTGMNLEQASSVTIQNFAYKTDRDSGYVRVYKHRKQGEVEFEIYASYRRHFEKYLAWLRELGLSEDGGLLFPFLAAPGMSVKRAKCFSRIQRLCKRLEFKFVGPRELRATRVNWILRKSKDEDLTSDIAQHTKQTLLKSYERPHHQVASIELSNFFNTVEEIAQAPGPGGCIQLTPTAIPEKPSSAPSPDCVSPSGCLFCVYQVDIDTFDHAWSLSSYGYFKSLELARHRPAKSSSVSHPADAVIRRVDAKLQAFRNLGGSRAKWVEEAHARVAEGDHHPRWSGFIALSELKG